MDSQLKLYKREEDEIQKVFAVTLDSWGDLEFFRPTTTPNALKHLADIYRDFFISAAPFLFGKFSIFHVPEDIRLPFKLEDGEDLHLTAKKYLKKNYAGKEAKAFIEELKSRGYFYEVKGKNPFMHRFMAFKNIGFLSEAEKDARFKVNSSFFTFDVLDEDSPVDLYGTPIGLMVKDGKILSSPLLGREALIVYKDGRCEIKPVTLKDISLDIEGSIYERPAYRNAPGGKYNLCIVGDKIVSIEKGSCRIPCSGFVIKTAEEHRLGEIVHYSGMEDVLFAIQCGNSCIVNGKPTTEFRSGYFNWKKTGSVPTVPGRYPLDYEKARAPRIAIGNNRDGAPVIFWAEGASKCRHIKGEDSCGASLLEMAEIAKDLGLVNAINLDGGGSAQILFNGERRLLISDRSFPDNSESERPVPIGLMVK